MSAVSVDELFSDAGIERTGAANWGDLIPKRLPGVFVISIADPSRVNIDALPERERPLWLPDQAIVYIGRAVQLSRRLAQFYRHAYGNSSPQRGGQAILDIDGPKRVDWAAVSNYALAEHLLITAFENKVGARPFGNRVRSAAKTTHFFPTPSQLVSSDG